MNFIGRPEDNSPQRCLSHKFERQDLAPSGSDAFSHCKYCGVAWSPATGVLLRHSQFDQLPCQPVSPTTLFKSILTREKNNRPRSSQFVHQETRQQCVKSLKNTFTKYSFLRSVPDRTVAIMDHYLSVRPTERFDYGMVMNAALVIACKFDEWAECPIRIELADPQIYQLCRDSAILPWEQAVLESLNWNANVVTPRCVADMILWQGVTTEAEIHDLCRECPTLKGYVLEYMHQLVDCILDTTLDHFSFYRYKPSGVAAAAIALSREIVGLLPWSPQLESLTGFPEAHIGHCLTVLREMKNSLPQTHSLHSVSRRYHQEKRLLKMNVEFVHHDDAGFRANSVPNAAHDYLNLSNEFSKTEGQSYPFGMENEENTDRGNSNQRIAEKAENRRRTPPRRKIIEKKRNDKNENKDNKNLSIGNKRGPEQ